MGAKVTTGIDIPLIYPDEAIEVVKNAHKMRTPIILWGPPGVGKTTAVRKACQDLEIEIKEVYLSRMTAADVGGLPTLNHETKKTTFYLPDLLTSLPGDRGIIFFDELTTADPQTRSAVLNLILEGKLGDFTLPDGWMCVAAANPKEFGGIYGDLGAAMNNRLIHFNMDVDYKKWTEWAAKNSISGKVIGFLSNGNQRHFTMSKEDFEKNPRAFPTPRNWARVSKIVETVRDEKILSKMVSGTVGMQAASAFMTWLGECDNLRPMEDYLAAAKKGPAELTKILPKKIAALYLVACATPAYANDHDGEAAMKLLNTLYMVAPTQKEFASTPVREIGVLGWELFGTAALDRKYHAEHSEEFVKYNEARSKELES